MSDLATLLPPNATPVELAIEQAAAQRLAAIDVSAVGELQNPDTCPVALLPWLAWSYGVDPWRSDWPEATKRAAIKAAPGVKRRAGTVGSLKAAVRAVGPTIGVVEWFQPGGSGRPFTADVIAPIDDPASTDGAQLVDDVLAAVASAKRASIHVTVRLAAELRQALSQALLIRTPVTRASASAQIAWAPTLSAGFTSALLVRRPINSGRLFGSAS